MMVYQTNKKITKSVISEIVRVEKEKGLTPEHLLEVAQNKDNPLHDLFQWDNKEAGREWRLQQARVIINEVKVIVGTKFISAFENVSIKVDDGTERFYKPINEIINNKELRQQIIQKAIQNIVYWKIKMKFILN
jgi:hypothetical protein